MPIASFIQTEQDAMKGLPIIGKLHKGEPKQQKTRKDGSTYEVVGRDLKHFRIEFEPEYKYLEPAWKELYGAKPTRFEPVLLNADRMDEALDFWKEEWTATTMLHRCDEKQQHVWYDKISGRYETSKINCEAPRCGCKTIARVNLILPEFIAVTGVLGTITLQTTSEEDLRTLIKRLSAIQVTYGTLRGVPFVFYREDRKTSAPDTDDKGNRTGKRKSITRSLIDVQVQPDFVRERFLRAMAGEPLALPAPRIEKPVVAPPVTISTADARKILGGSNGETRRIGVEHWSKDPDKIKTIIEALRKENVLTAEQGESDALKLIDKEDWLSFTRGQDAKNAIVAAWRNRDTVFSTPSQFDEDEIARLEQEAKRAELEPA